MQHQHLTGAKRLRVLTVLGVLAGGLTLVLPAAAGAIGGGRLYVSHASGSDVGTCRLVSHPCASIGYAVGQANPGDTIQVAPGTYNEQLAINKTLTIVGASGNTTVIQPTTMSPADTDPLHPWGTPYPIVDVTAGKATLQNLVIDGSAAYGSFSSCSQFAMGVYVHNAKGILTGDTIENAAESTPAGGLFGCQTGIGVYVASDTGAANVSLTGDTVVNYAKDGIACRGATTTCSVSSSTVTGIGPTTEVAQNGIEIFGAKSGTVSGDKVSGNAYSPATVSATGLLLYDVGSLSVSGNKLSANDVNAYLGTDGTGPTPTAWSITSNKVGGATDGGDGIDLDSTTNPVTISANTVKGSAGNGIALWGVTGAVVHGNTVKGNHGNGIYVGGPGGVATTSTTDTVSANTASNNSGDGILTDTDSSSVSVSGNTTVTNGLYDLENLGTGNTYTGNTCSPVHDSHPSGLC